MTEQYEFEIGADVKAARKAIEKLIQETQQGFNKISFNTTVSAIRDSFSVAERFMRPVFQLIEDSIQESLEAEAANKKLANSMRVVGDFSQQAFEGLKRFSEELAANTSYSDDQAVAALALAKAYGLTNREAQELVKVGADLAALTGDELNPSVEKLAKTYNGFISRELKQLRPELRGLTEEQLANGEAIRILGAYVEGSAAKMQKGFGGAVKEVSKATNEFKEALGDYVTQSKGAENATRLVADVINFATKNMDAFATSFINATASVLGLGAAKAGIDALAASIGFLRKEQDLTLDSIEQIRLKASQAFSEKQAEERIKRERAANVAAEKAITEFNGIRLDLEKRGLTEIEAINNEAARRIAIVRAAAEAGQPEAVRKQAEYIAGIRIDAAKRVAKIQQDLDKKVLDSRNEMENIVKGKLEEVTNAPLSGLIKFVVQGQQELDKTKAKIDATLNELIKGTDIAPAIKNQMKLAAEAFKEKLSSGFNTTVATGLALNVLSAVRKGAAGAAEAVGGIVGGIVDLYFPGMGKLVDQMIQFLSLGPEETKRLVREFREAVPQVVETIATTLPDLIADIVKDTPRIINKIIEMLPRVMDAVVKGIPNVITAMVEAVPQIIASLVKAIPSLFVNAAKGFLEFFYKGWPQVIKGLVTAIVEGVPEIIKGFAEGLVQAAKDFVNAIFDAIKGVGNFFSGSGGGGQALGGVGSFIGDVVGGVGDFFGGLFAQGGTVPDSPGLRGDRALVRANAGEEILSRDLTNRLSAFLDGNGGGGGATTVILKVGERELARAMLDINRGGFRTA